MSQISDLLVLLSLVTFNFYIADSYTLTASVLNQLGYNTQSPFVNLNDNNIDKIDPNAFNGYKILDSIKISSNNILTIDLEAFKYAANITVLYLNLASLNKFTNSKNVKLPNLNQLTLTTNLTSLNKAMFNAFPALGLFSTFEVSSYYFGDSGSTLKTVDVHTFESLSKLMNLNLAFNLLTGFEYLQIPKNLRKLNLAGNKMNYFALSRTMGVLDYLDLSYNLFRSFKSMDFTFLANLTYLDLSDNPHAYPNEIAGHLKPLVKLRQVGLANLSISSIASNYFKYNPKLEYIDLSDNKISSLDNRTFSGLNDLRTIYLYVNSLSKISSGTFNNPSLLTIDVAGNEISQLDKLSFYGFSFYGTSVDLGGNKLTKILPRTFYNKFNRIILQGNQITEIDLDGVSQVGFLSLAQNKIEKIQPGSFKNIVNLDLSSNLLTELKNGSFVGQIGFLRLASNGIEKIEEGAFNYANISNYIYLGFNKLTEINQTMFAGLDQLQYIYLHNNMLSKIEPGSFANLPNLREVYLHNNQLTQLDSSMFAGSNNLKMIYLKGNPILSTTNVTTLKSVLCPPAVTDCRIDTTNEIFFDPLYSYY